MERSLRSFANSENLRQRCVLPLPASAFEPLHDFSRAKVSRSVKRRLAVRSKVAHIAQDSATALNEIFAGEHRPANLTDCGEVSAAQRMCARSLAADARALGAPPTDLSRQGALEELLARKSYGDQPATLAPLDVDRLALPSDGFAPVDLQQVGAVGRFVVERLFFETTAKRFSEGKACCIGVEAALLGSLIAKSRKDLYEIIDQACGKWTHHFWKTVPLPSGHIHSVEEKR